MTYKVSIIIPVYNAAEFIIRDTMKSIEKQTMDFKDIEVILVNDCSTDNTEEVINEYAKQHDNIVPINLRENNGGPGIPRNIGVTYASADYLMFLDQDDTYNRHACETLYNKIVSEDVDVVCGNHNMVSHGVSSIGVNFDWTDEEELRIENINENPNFLKMSVVVWSRIFRKDFVIKNNLKFIKGGIGEDIFFSVRSLLLANGIVLLPNFPVVNYQVRSDSFSHKIDPEYIDKYTDFYLSFFDYCNRNLKNNLLYQPLFEGRLNHIMSILLYPNLYYDDFSHVLIKIHELFYKVSEKPFQFDDKLNRLFFDTIIRDEYPFENTILVFSSIKNLLEKKVESSIKYLDQESKLYIDTGKGYNEDDSLTEFYKINEFNEVEFNLEKFENIKRLRFDPISWHFISCEILEVTSNNGTLILTPTNSVNPNDAKHKFINIDSQYSITGDFEGLENIKIKFKVEILNNRAITAEFNKKK